MATGAEHPIDQETRWNFCSTGHTFLSLDEFLDQKEADGIEFFAGKEPWMKGVNKLTWQFFSGSVLGRWTISLKGLLSS
jgi:hypothetical protein